MKTNRLSGRERGEENLAKVRSYLAGLTVAHQSLPFEDGRPNITAIAEACGVLRNVFYSNAGVKRLLAEFIGGNRDSEGLPILARAERQLEIKDRRILQLEQQLANAKAEKEELRKLLAIAEQKLHCYKVIEEEVLKAGRRVVP
jgi:hypothetical protein